jgi:DNA polymerase-4
MDAFYASIEQRDDPRLRGRPVIVGGHARRGVVLAASYEVRPFGVRSAMPMARALQLAPDAVVVPPRREAYAEASARVFAILHTVTPLVEPLSLDEAFLDVTASASLFGSASEIAAQLRRRIADEIALPASAGIAAVKFIAKIASDYAKPNGQRLVEPDAGAAFLAPLPVGRLWGVGPKLEARLRAMEITTIGDLARRGAERLQQRLGETGRDLWELSQGIDTRPVVPDREAKSIGAEETFEEDLTTPQQLQPHIHAQALRVGERLRHAGLRARCVQLKLKLADIHLGIRSGLPYPSAEDFAGASPAPSTRYKLITRRTTFAVATDDGQALYRAAAELLREHPPAAPVRLTGVSAQSLEAAAATQMGLFARAPTAGDRVNQALDKITEKFGSGALTTADLTHGPPRAKTRRR